jgi:glycosyltransferase involved in cell wall biosynthesis
MKNQLVSIVIPSKNEEAYIGKPLSSLLNQTAINRQTPVIIADAGSTDGTLKVIEGFKHLLNIRVVPGGLPAVGRNIGASFTNSEYILFLDADVTLGEHDSLQKALDLAETKNLDLVSTHIHSTDGNYADKLFWHLHGFASVTKLVGSYAAGMFILIRSDVFRKLGGFDEQISLGEDWDLTHQIAPAKFAISPSFINTSSRRFSSMGYMKTFYQYFMVAASHRFRHQDHRNYYEVKFN